MNIFVIIITNVTIIIQHALLKAIRLNTNRNLNISSRDIQVDITKLFLSLSLHLYTFAVRTIRYETAANLLKDNSFMRQQKIVLIGNAIISHTFTFRTSACVFLSTNFHAPLPFIFSVNSYERMCLFPEACSLVLLVLSYQYLTKCTNCIVRPRYPVFIITLFSFPSTSKQYFSTFFSLYTYYVFGVAYIIHVIMKCNLPSALDL